MHFAKFQHQVFGCCDVTHFPTGYGIGFTERVDHKTPFRQSGKARDTLMLMAIEYQMLIDLIAGHNDVGVVEQTFQHTQIFSGKDTGGRIVRCVQNDHAGAWRDGVFDGLPIDAVIGIAHLHIDWNAAIDFNRRAVTIVSRLEQNHLVAGADKGGDSGEDAIGCPRRYRDFMLRIVCRAVEKLYLLGYGLAQTDNACHGRILIQARVDIFAEQCAQFGRTIKIREALRQIDRVVLRRELRHGSENRSADIGEFGGDGLRVGRHGVASVRKVLSICF